MVIVKAPLVLVNSFPGTRRRGMLACTMARARKPSTPASLAASTSISMAEARPRFDAALHDAAVPTEICRKRLTGQSLGKHLCGRCRAGVCERKKPAKAV
jgi:hypothetical protein